MKAMPEVVAKTAKRLIVAHDRTPTLAQLRYSHGWLGQQARARTALKQVIAAAIKYATNHIIAHIPSYAVRHTWYRRILGWRIGPHAAIFMGQYVEIGRLRAREQTVSIGDGTIINHGCLLNVAGGLVIGEHASISSGVSIVTGAHDMNDPDFSNVLKPIVIGDHVWVGSNAVILGGVTIGDGAVICAGSVVRSDVRSNAVVDGVPGKVVGTRRLSSATYSFNYHPLFE